MKYFYQVVIYYCSDIVERPREEQEYCYICRFVVKLCIVDYHGEKVKISLTPTS